MPRRKPARLILRCRLCAAAGRLVEPSCEHPVHAAVDHALDHHRAALLADPDRTLGALSVAA